MLHTFFEKIESKVQPLDLSMNSDKTLPSGLPCVSVPIVNG